jgi:cyclic dehypoxanthinyl futalosine synthase
MLDAIRSKVINGERITRDECLFLLRETPLLDLAPLAQTVRWRHNPERVVTFVIDTNLNYTNVCDAYCTFCAFYRTERDSDAYTHTVEEVMSMIGAAAEKGVTTVLMQGGLNPKLTFSYYTELVRESLRRYPQVHPHFFSAPEIMKMTQVSGLSIAEVLAELKQAGLKTIPGGGSEILSDRVKKLISQLAPKGKVSDWTAVHREAHKLGIRTTATMMYGHLEEPEDVIGHLEHVRQLQDEAPGFTAFIPWSYKRENNPLGKRVKEEAGANKYLRMIAVSRLYLDNIQHIQASWFSEGKKTGQIALHFGADDFGGTLFDENVMQEAGFYNRTTVAEIIAMIRESGFVPAQRTTLYEILHRLDSTTPAQAQMTARTVD